MTHVEMNGPAENPVPSEAERIERALGPAREAFWQLAGTHSGYLTRRVNKLVGDPAKAEEIVQAALVKAHDRFLSYEGKGCFRAWLYAIARHEAFDALRRLGREPVSLDQEVEDEDGNSVPLGELLPASAKDEPEYVVKHRLRLVGLLREIAKLPPRAKEVMLMRMAGMDTALIADVAEAAKRAVNQSLERDKQEQQGYFDSYTD